MSSLAALMLRMQQYSESLPQELDLGIPLRRDVFDKLLETNTEEDK